MDCLLNLLKMDDLQPTEPLESLLPTESPENLSPTENLKYLQPTEHLASLQETQQSISRQINEHLQGQDPTVEQMSIEPTEQDVNLLPTEDLAELRPLEEDFTAHSDTLTYVQAKDRFHSLEPSEYSIGLPVENLRDLIRAEEEENPHTVHEEPVTRIPVLKNYEEFKKQKEEKKH